MWTASPCRTLPDGPRYLYESPCLCPPGLGAGPVFAHPAKGWYTGQGKAVSLADDSDT